MASRSIKIRVAPEAARAYESASAEERRKLNAVLSLKLTEAARQPRPLLDVIKEVSRKAQERGLTPEILEELLDE